MTDVKARWLGHKLRAEVTIAVDDTLSVADGKAIVAKLQAELHEHLPPLDAATVQFDTSGVSVPEAEGDGHHHAPDPFAVKSALAEGSLAIVDTKDGERMRLTVSRQVEKLEAVVRIVRPGNAIETLELLPSATDPARFQSQAAPAEPHEFEAELELASGGRRETLPFQMKEPAGHQH